MKILVVEPDKSTGRTLSLMLRESGHIVHRLDMIEYAIPLLNGYWPDAILMNYELGDDTAPTICEEIQQLFGELPSTLVYSTNSEHRLAALRFPETSFLKSPFSPEELQYALDDISISRCSA